MRQPAILRGRLTSVLARGSHAEPIAPMTSASRLQRLLGFMEQDPQNLRLIADATQAAYDEGDNQEVARLFDRYGAISPPPRSLVNLRGLAAIQDRQFGRAAGVFEGLLADDPSDAGARFNLAWCEAMLKNYAGALDLLDDQALAISPRAPSLKIQMLHHLGRLDDALAEGEALAERFPQDSALAGALATVAIDAENLPMAMHYAVEAGDQHDGLSALGLLKLNDNEADASLELFGRALKAYPEDTRAQLGAGLALLAKNDAKQAQTYIDRAAEGFGSHLGSWVAAGWAYFISGDYVTSRARFEQARGIDDNFAEIHGGLAVLDIVEGQMESAKTRTEIALRLDRNCLSAALAKSLILASQGDLKTAERVRTLALNAPIDSSGRTIAQVLAKMSLGMGRASN
jgi:tetratricopeptide (TPR) repeat protein